MGLGPDRGRPVVKLRTTLKLHLASAAERVQRGGLLCANVDGFDLHGRVAFGVTQRQRLEELVRYCARPPLGNDRLEREADGRYRLQLNTRWRDGTTHLRFDPIELMERLAAQIPKPRINLVLYSGVLAPNAKLRSKVVAYDRPTPSREPPLTETQTRAERESWSELMRSTFGLDVLACPRCGDRIRYIATITDPQVARRILEHLNLLHVRRRRLLRARPRRFGLSRTGTDREERRQSWLRERANADSKTRPNGPLRADGVKAPKNSTNRRL